MTVADRILTVAAQKPKLTERELAEEIFGSANGYQQRVNGDCRLLVAQGRLKRSGSGGVRDPYTYTVVR